MRWRFHMLLGLLLLGLPAFLSAEDAGNFQRAPLEPLARLWGEAGTLALNDIEFMIREANSVRKAELTTDAVDAMFGILVPELFPHPGAWTPTREELEAELARLGSSSFRERKKVMSKFRNLPLCGEQGDWLIPATKAGDPEVSERVELLIQERSALMAHLEKVRHGPLSWGISARLKSLPAGEVRTRFRTHTMAMLDPERREPWKLYCLLTHLVKLVTIDGTDAEVERLIACLDQWPEVRSINSCLEPKGKNQERLVLHAMRSKRKGLEQAWSNAHPDVRGSQELLWDMIEAEHKSQGYIRIRLAGVFQDAKALDQLITQLRDAIHKKGAVHKAIADFEDVSEYLPKVPKEMGELLWPIAKDPNNRNAEAAAIVLAKCPDPEWMEPLFKLYMEVGHAGVASDFIYFHFREEVTKLFAQVPNGKRSRVEALLARFKGDYDPHHWDYL